MIGSHETKVPGIFDIQPTDLINNIWLICAAIGLSGAIIGALLSPFWSKTKDN